MQAKEPEVFLQKAVDQAYHFRRNNMPELDKGSDMEPVGGLLGSELSFQRSQKFSG